jgi:hypothetical protein
MSFLRINRFGRVEANQLSFNQCKDVGHKEYDYQISICCPDTNVDSNEFIIDHAYIHQKVVSYFKTNMTSCEGICKDLAIHLKKTMAKHKVHMVDMYIKIMPVLPLIDNQPPVNRAFMEYSESGRFI